MRKLGVLIFSLALSVITLISCSKEESEITGHLTYQDAFTGVEKNAGNATLQLFSFKKGVFEDFVEVEVDNSGIYSISGLMKGEWQIQASLIVNGHKYQGETKSFKTNGRKRVVKNIVLNY